MGTAVPEPLQVVLGAVQNDPKLLQQGWPEAPQVPQDPAAHMLAGIEGQAWPAAVQRL